MCIRDMLYAYTSCHSWSTGTQESFANKIAEAQADRGYPYGQADASPTTKRCGVEDANVLQEDLYRFNSI